MALALIGYYASSSTAQASSCKTIDTSLSSSTANPTTYYPVQPAPTETYQYPETSSDTSQTSSSCDSTTTVPSSLLESMSSSPIRSWPDSYSLTVTESMESYPVSESQTTQQTTSHLSTTSEQPPYSADYPSVGSSSTAYSSTTHSSIAYSSIAYSSIAYSSIAYSSIAYSPTGHSSSYSTVSKHSWSSSSYLVSELSSTASPADPYPTSSTGLITISSLNSHGSSTTTGKGQSSKSSGTTPDYPTSSTEISSGQDSSTEHYPSAAESSYATAVESDNYTIMPTEGSPPIETAIADTSQYNHGTTIGHSYTKVPDYLPAPPSNIKPTETPWSSPTQTQYAEYPVVPTFTPESSSRAEAHGESSVDSYPLVDPTSSQDLFPSIAQEVDGSSSPEYNTGGIVGDVNEGHNTSSDMVRADTTTDKASIMTSASVLDSIQQTEPDSSDAYSTARAQPALQTSGGADPPVLGNEPDTVELVSISRRCGPVHQALLMAAIALVYL
ncbi:uncharacterized protein B0I36DRAFT_356298 [Microdochium trichocladiopsis]|uniref:Uncharacterized protein n=1 Tax=Microdochium trichocladiopsis TaxID=1682393 RepID=A0A9P8XQN2_9PEZI|nr:uncharacterized protein B0I36DRAFT_356298 [Microdochium trichocladiopsis]KAH7012216.1 hypothetical protein B0I36DRAFT_356298 [Microdochium trichocladiopsis]